MPTIFDAAEYDVVELDARSIGLADATADGPASRVHIVYKRTGMHWTPWVMVAQSAALASIGITSLGLYTLQPLRPRRQTRLGWSAASRIGQYGGIILGTFNDINSRQAKAQMAAWARSGKAHLLQMKIGRQWAVVDGEHAGPPFLHRANDARGIPGFKNNISFSAQGVATATRAVPAADLNAARALQDIGASELLVGYGEGFWRMHGSLGKRCSPVVIDRVLMPFLRLRI